MNSIVNITTPTSRARHRDVGDSIARWLTSEREQLTRKLRISLVDSCNLSCFFCHNDGQGALGSSRGKLSPLELSGIVAAAVESGIREVKLTGGEPLLYRHGDSDVVDAVRAISSARESSGPFGLSITTNGLLLHRFADQLLKSGLDRATVSLHTLDKKVFESAIDNRASVRKLQAIRDGIAAAAESGLTPLKVNMVLFGGHLSSHQNVTSVTDVAGLCRDLGVSELRLYTMLKHNDLSDGTFKAHYRFWDEKLAELVASQLTTTDGSRIAQEILSFVESSPDDIYPKRTLVTKADGLQVAIDAMEDGRFEAYGLPAEGPYAMRLSAAGHLRGIMSQSEYVDVGAELRGGASHNDLVSIFTAARAQLMPAALSDVTGARPSLSRR